MTRGEILFALISGLLVNECCDISPWFAVRLMRWSARVRYRGAPQLANIRAEELAALIKDRPGKLFKLLTAIGFVLHALLLAVVRDAPHEGRRLRARSIAAVYNLQTSKMILALSASCAAVTAGIYGWTSGEPWYECAVFGCGGAIIAILLMIGAWELNNLEKGTDHGVSVLGLVAATMFGYGIYFMAGEEIYPSAGTAVGIGMVVGIIVMAVVVVLGELMHRQSRKKLRRNIRPIRPDSR